MTDAGWIGCGCLSSRNATSLTLSWDPALVGCLEDSQQWVLGAMARHGPRLVPMLWRILGNEQDVCDAYQDTFVKLAYLPQGKKPRNVKAYLFRTASNTAISILRKKKSFHQVCRNMSDQGYLKEYSRDNHDLDAEHLRTAMRINLARLPEYLRNTVVLYDLAGLSYEQTAKILGVSKGSIRVYRCRALQLLSVWMAKDRKK